MFNFFSKFGSCCHLPRRRRPAMDDTFLCHIGTSGDCSHARGNRVYCRQDRPSDWRPALSAIMEDGLDQDNDKIIRRKSDESFRKKKSAAGVARVSGCHDKTSPKPKIYVSLFSATPYMF